MISITGDPTSDDDYYEKNKDTIHNFFREGTIPLKLARRLGAPIDVVDPQDIEEVFASDGDDNDNDKKPAAK